MALYALTVPALTDRQRFRAEVRRLAAPAQLARVEAAFGATDPTLLAAFGQRPHVLRGVPLGYRVDRFTGRAASVAIWSVALAATRRFGGQSQWRTLVVDLVWTANGWRVSGGRGAAGPSPSTPLSALAMQAARFRSFTYGP